MASRTMPPRLRWTILDRDGYTCVYCGRTPADGVRLHVDHVQPWADGGTDDPENLATSCDDCNLGKSKRAPTQRTAPRAADRAPGVCCPTRLRIAAISVRLDTSYAAALTMAMRGGHEHCPPPDRFDARWVDVVMTDPMRFTRWLVVELAERLDGKSEGLRPFA